MNFETVFGASDIKDDKRDELISRLQQEVQREKDARLEERFVGIVSLVVLLDVVFFSVMDNFGGPIALLVLELIALCAIAKRMGIETIVELISRVLDRISGKSSEIGE